jgi:hypothetical protein
MYRKLKIEQHEHHNKFGLNSSAKIRRED